MNARYSKAFGMNVAELRDFAERQPFRPFTVRLSNGAQYTFSEPRNLGAPKDWHMIIFFGESDWTLIDTENITEVIAR
ncbi:MAG: hypothetical protein HY736_21920 [Verrucomicrobia bacterium]|nr:hypothetical protein [Verrucomicrobiota bacterium]